MGKRTEEIRKRIQIAEERKGEPLTNKQKRAIEKKVIAKSRRENAIRGVFLALGITIGAGGHALLSSGNSSKEQKENNSTETVEDLEENNNLKTFSERLKVDENTLKQIQTEEQDKKQDSSEKIDEILEEYNEMYETDLTRKDISYMKSHPGFLGINENGKYIQDYKENTPVKEYIHTGIDDIYILINNRDNTIISSIGKVSDKIENIDTKIVMDYNREEYLESDKKINLVQGKNEEEIETIYAAIKDEYRKEIQEERE